MEVEDYSLTGFVINNLETDVLWRSPSYTIQISFISGIEEVYIPLHLGLV